MLLSFSATKTGVFESDGWPDWAAAVERAMIRRREYQARAPRAMRSAPPTPTPTPTPTLASGDSPELFPEPLVSDDGVDDEEVEVEVEVALFLVMLNRSLLN